MRWAIFILPTNRRFKRCTLPIMVNSQQTRSIYLGAWLNKDLLAMAVSYKKKRGHTPATGRPAGFSWAERFESFNAKIFFTTVAFSTCSCLFARCRANACHALWDVPVRYLYSALVSFAGFSIGCMH